MKEIYVVVEWHKEGNHTMVPVAVFDEEMKAFIYINGIKEDREEKGIKMFVHVFNINSDKLERMIIR